MDVVEEEMQVRLSLPGNGESGFSRIDLASLDGRGRRPLAWAADRAIAECVHEFVRRMIYVGEVPVIRYSRVTTLAPERRSEARRPGGSSNDVMVWLANARCRR
jgi:hypothetical protein